MASLGAAKNVSPLIRFCRYAALGTGLLYGTMRMSSLTKKEKIIQEEEDAIRARRNARLQKEKEEYDRVEMAALGKECGVVN